MSNPLAIAIKGKGVFPLVARARTIASRYDLTAAKMNRSVMLLVATLQRFGAKATLPVTAAALARHSAVTREHQSRGLEFAVHGLAHVDHTQLSQDEQHARFQRAKKVFERAGVHATGFRCPYLRWNADTLAALEQCGFAYDSSQALVWDVTNGLETDSYRRVLEFYGAQPAGDYPALPRIVGDIVRIPYCMPDDEALVERLKLTDSQAMAEMWLEVLQRTYEMGELFTLGLHPERAALCQAALHATLERACALSPGVWFARLDEIVSWWRALGQTPYQVRRTTDSMFHLSIEAPPAATILARNVKVEAPTQAWTGGYQRVYQTDFALWSDKRPFIGIAPGSPSTLYNFLRQQGYLVEVSTDAQSYSFYLQPGEFSPEDERRLLTQIEKGDWPLLRLARWPHGVQSALSITGDIDAFTLWDYGLRAFGS